VSTSRLSVDNAINLRDVGGLACRGGGSTRHLVLLRSGSLRLLAPDDARVLLSVYGVGVVVDLRTAHEVWADGPSALAGRGGDGPSPAGRRRPRRPARDDPRRRP